MQTIDDAIMELVRRRGYRTINTRDLFLLTLYGLTSLRVIGCTNADEIPQGFTGHVLKSSDPELSKGQVISRNVKGWAKLLVNRRLIERVGAEVYSVPALQSTASNLSDAPPPPRQRNPAIAAIITNAVHEIRQNPVARAMQHVETIDAATASAASAVQAAKLELNKAAEKFLADYTAAEVSFAAMAARASPDHFHIMRDHMETGRIKAMGTSLEISSAIDEIQKEHDARAAVDEKERANFKEYIRFTEEMLATIEAKAAELAELEAHL
jgi:hypothetical protein